MLKKESLTILLLFGLVLFIRVVYIPTGKVWYDEATSIIRANQSVKDIYRSSFADPNTPTYFVLLHYYVKVFGDAEKTLRCFSIFFGLLSSLIIFQIAKELANGNPVPKIVLFLTAVSPFHLYFSHEIRVYSLLIFVSSLTLLSLVKCIYTGRPKNPWYLLYLLSLVLGAYLHVMYLLFILALDVFVVVEALRGRRKDILLGCLLLPNALLVCSEALFCVVGYPFITNQVKNAIDIKLAIGASGAGSTIMEDFLSTIVRVYWEGVLSPAILVLTAITLCLGLKSIRTGAKANVSFLFLLVLSISLFISPSLSLAVSSRHITYVFPVVVILMSFGAYYVWGALHKILWSGVRPNAAIVACAVLLATTLSVQAGFKLRDGGQFCSKQLTSFLNDNSSPNAIILVAPSWKRYPLLYYLEDSIPVKGVNTNLDELGCSLSLEEEIKANWHPIVSKSSVENLENYIHGYKNIWYINHEHLPDPENLVLGWLVENTDLKKIYYVNCSEIRDDPATRMPVFLFKNEEI